MSILSMDKIASISHDMFVHKTMFIKHIMSHTQSIGKGKGDNQSIPTCHHCGIVGHIRSNYFQIRSQKPWKKTLIPRKDEPGFEEQVKVLSDQVKLISEKLAYLTPNEQISVLVNNQKASKQVWVKKEDNLCLVSHTALKILDTCLWYSDSGCSKHMIVMIHSKNLAQHFWGEAVNTAYHIINRVYLRPETNKTPYEIW
jgi:hypothetical protein